MNPHLGDQAEGARCLGDLGTCANQSLGREAEGSRSPGTQQARAEQGPGSVVNPGAHGGTPLTSSWWRRVGLSLWPLQIAFTPRIFLAALFLGRGNNPINFIISSRKDKGIGLPLSSRTAFSLERKTRVGATRLMGNLL